MRGVGRVWPRLAPTPSPNPPDLTRDESSSTLALRFLDDDELCEAPPAAGPRLCQGLFDGRMPFFVIYDCWRGVLDSIQRLDCIF